MNLLPRLQVASLCTLAATLVSFFGDAGSSPSVVPAAPVSEFGQAAASDQVVFVDPIITDASGTGDPPRTGALDLDAPGFTKHPLALRHVGAAVSG